MPTEANSIQVSHNGDTETIAKLTTLTQAIELWGYGDKKVAAAVNGDFIPRGCYSSTELQQDDKIDIVRPVGGG